MIAHYMTTTDSAVDIAQKGFPVDHYEQVSSDIYFIRTVERWNNIGTPDPMSIVCVRLSLGHILQVEDDAELEFSAFNNEPHLPQTLECITSGKIKVRFPGQIENWIIIWHTNDSEEFDPSYYDGCI